MKLSKRLQLIASMVPHGLPCADIGSDHGLLVKYLIDNRIVPFAYASDNKKGPYERLSTNLRSLIEANLVEVNLVDGITSLPEKYRCVIIAGMGGDLICNIIKSNQNLLKNIDFLLLSPHGNEKELRECVVSLGYKIKDENIIFEDHYYEAILFERGNENYTNKELTYGPINLSKKTDIFKQKYIDKINFNKDIISKFQLNSIRKEEIKNSINLDIEMLENL